MLFDKYRRLSKTTIIFIPADSLFVFFILPTARFQGMFRGVFRSVPKCPLIPHNGNSSRKGTFL